MRNGTLHGLLTNQPQALPFVMRRTLYVILMVPVVAIVLVFSNQPVSVTGSAMAGELPSKDQKDSKEGDVQVIERTLKTDPLKNGAVKIAPEPPAKPWKCSLHDHIPASFLAKSVTPEVDNRDQSKARAENHGTGFRWPEMAIPFGEFQHIIQLDESNQLFVWAATEKTFPAIDQQHKRVVQPVFGAVEGVVENHYVFSIRNQQTDEITVISVPVPPKMMVEIPGGEKPEAPGWIEVDMRSEGESEVTRRWLHFSMNE